MEPGPGDRIRTGLSAVPRAVWALGFVSMFMDISSEMIHSLLPVFLVTVVAFGLTTPHFLSAGNFESIGFQLPDLGLLTLAMLAPKMGTLPGGAAQLSFGDYARVGH